jgi:hypothetical protein
LRHMFAFGQVAKCDVRRSFRSAVGFTM